LAECYGVYIKLYYRPPSQTCVILGKSEFRLATSVSPS